MPGDDRSNAGTFDRRSKQLTGRAAITILKNVATIIPSRCLNSGTSLNESVPAAGDLGASVVQGLGKTNKSRREVAFPAGTKTVCGRPLPHSVTELTRKNPLEILDGT